MCAYLRKRLWGLELTAGIDESGFESNSIYSSFVIGIFLTDRGFQHLDEVQQDYVSIWYDLHNLFFRYFPRALPS